MMVPDFVPDLKQAIENVGFCSVTFSRVDGAFTALVMFPGTSLQVLKFVDSDSLETVLRSAVDAIYPRGYPEASRFQPICIGCQDVSLPEACDE